MTNYTIYLTEGFTLREMTDRYFLQNTYEVTVYLKNTYIALRAKTLKTGFRYIANI
jgi:hypothetical protein